MAKAKKRKYRNLDSTPPPARKGELETRQLILTLGVANGDVIKVERLEQSGERQAVSEAEFAALTGEDEEEDFGAALEEAYSAGATDAIDDQLGEDDEEDEEEALRRFMLRRAAGRRLLRQGVRRFILRRVIRRELMERRPHSGGRAARSAAKA